MSAPEHWDRSELEKDKPLGKPAPRRGESARKGINYKKSDTTKIRTALAVAVRQDPGFNADVYSRRVAELLDMDKKDVRSELNWMIAKKRVVEKAEQRKGSTKIHDNLYPPVYTIEGEVVTIGEAQRSRWNIHEFPYNTIRERVLSGMTMEAALLMPPTTPGGVRRALQHPKAQRHALNPDW